MKNPNFKFRTNKGIDLLSAYGAVERKEQTGLIFIKLPKRMVMEGGVAIQATLTCWTPYTVLGNMRLFKLVPTSEGGVIWEQVEVVADIELYERTGTATILTTLEPVSYLIMVEHVNSDKRINLTASIRLN